MASYAYPPVVPPGQSPPLAVVTPTDHRAWIYIAAPLALSMTLLSSALRVFIRWNARVGWGLDDVALGVSTIISFVQSGIIIAAGSHGLGTSRYTSPEPSLQEAQKLYYSSNLLYILSLGTSRQAVVLFLRRVTPVILHKKVLTFILCIEAAWIVAFFLAGALQCDLSSPWLLAETCAAGWFARWEALEITGAALEVAIFASAIWALVWNLQVAYRKRFTIAIAFALRMLVMVIFIGFRLASFDKRGFTSDPTLHETSFICWTQAEMNLSIIGATVPIAHRFLASLVTYYGGAGGRNLSQSQQATMRAAISHTTDTFKLSSLQSGKSGKTGKTARTDSVGKENPPQEPFMSGARNDVRYTVGVEHRDATGEATPRSNSDTQRLMIRKDVTYKIEYDT